MDVVYSGEKTTEVQDCSSHFFPSPKVVDEYVLQLSDYFYGNNSGV